MIAIQVDLLLLLATVVRGVGVRLLRGRTAPGARAIRTGLVAVLVLALATLLLVLFGEALLALLRALVARVLADALGHAFG